MNRSNYHFIFLVFVLIFNINYNINCQHSKCSLHQNCLNQIHVSSNISHISNSLSPKANQSLPRPMSSLYQCSCDSNSCHIYGNCCLDVELNKTSLSVSNYSCISIYTYQKLLSFRAISKCSKLWSAENNKYDNRNSRQIKYECEEANHSRDFMLTIPLTNNSTKTTYKNVYCAICNFDIENAEAWKANTYCSKTNLESCVLTFDTTDQLISHCSPPNLIDFCPDDSSFEQKLDCSLYLAPIKAFKGFETVLLKNTHCALCNNFSANKFNCPDGRKSDYPIQFDSEYSLSFSIVLDFNFKGKVGAEEKCDQKSIYDPWKKICRRVYCRDNTTFLNGKCVEFDDNANYTNQFDICPKIIIQPEEYKQLSDGSVIVMASNKIYNTSQYLINHETNTLTICSYSQEVNFMKSKFDESHSYLTIICLTISIISLAIKISHFFLKPEPRRISSILVLFLSISLIFAQTLFLFGVNRVEIPILCQLIAILMHYFFLASFFWMNVLSYDIYQTFASMLVKHSSNLLSRNLLIYSIYGWTLPFFITSTAVIVDQLAIADYDLSGISPGYGTVHCWIANRLALTVYFAAPLAILLIINTGKLTSL